MYTQCPECETYFRVTEDDLEAAEGQVRCSRCEAIFDARARLLTPAQEHALAADGDPATAEGARAVRDAAEAALPESDDPAIGDLFGDDAPRAADGPAAAGALDPALDPSMDLGEVDALDAPRADPRFDDGAAPLAADAAPGAGALPEPRFDEALPRAPLGFELPTGASPLLTDAGRPRPKRGPWLAACAVLVLALGAQLVHANREPLVRDPRIGPTLVDAYRSLRLPLKAPTDLARLAVQRADVTSHPVYRDVLYITATVTNEAEFPQPLPLLRVRLDDRWGEPVGVRIFRPEEYLRRAGPAARAEPGRAYAVALEVVDPGNEAVGYALTPCLPQGETLVCLGDG
jgi:predicted Zn finger-like uncharacterized protein